MASNQLFTASLQKIRHFVRQHEMLLGGEQVLIAVSGGIDSMVLLHSMLQLAPAMNLELAVAHFDHGLRESSREDANFVVDRAREKGLKFFVGHADVKRLAADGKLSLEDAARTARYSFLKKVARKQGYKVIMTGHTADDNAETVMLNLMRGSGVRGLAAIPPVRALGEGITLARPLLELSRSDLEKHAEEFGVPWQEDESNESLVFTRNRIRHQLMPILKEFNPSIVSTLNSTADIMRNLEQYLSQSVEVAIQKVTTEKTKERLTLNLSLIRHYLPAMQSEIIQRSVAQAFDMQPISYGAVDRTLELMYKETGSKAELGGTLSALRDRETLVFCRELPPPPTIERKFEPGAVVDLGRTRLKTAIFPKEEVQFTRNSKIEFFDADKISGELLIRTWKEGDRFQPLGMEGEKKVSDFLVDQKIPRDKKRNVLVIENGEEIIWICGMRIDERYRVTDDTVNVLKMELKYNAGRR